MRNRKIFPTALAILVLGICRASVSGQGDYQKMYNAFEFGKRKFAEELAAVERSHALEVQAAKTRREKGIYMAKVRYVQGLKFLNQNSNLPQSMRHSINRELKEFSNPAEPVGPTIEEPVVSLPQNKGKRSIGIEIEAPDDGWSVQIVMVKRVKNELWVLSQLRHQSGISTFENTSIRDHVQIQASADIPVRHFVLNQTWNAKNTADISYIRGMRELGRDWVFGKILKVQHVK